jgi:hypothetical protein
VRLETTTGKRFKGRTYDRHRNVFLLRDDDRPVRELVEQADEQLVVLEVAEAEAVDVDERVEPLGGGRPARGRADEVSAQSKGEGGKNDVRLVKQKGREAVAAHSTAPKRRRSMPRLL